VLSFVLFALQGAHFVLSLYICALSSSSHLAALITLRKYFLRYTLIARIRITLVIGFAIFLLASKLAAIAKHKTWLSLSTAKRPSGHNKLPHNDGLHCADGLDEFGNLNCAGLPATSAAADVALQSQIYTLTPVNLVAK
jgi:hypothetical protein